MKSKCTTNYTSN